MVRSLQGAKIKNVKNLINDLLEDVKPEAIWIHASTNEMIKVLMGMLARWAL